MKKWLIYPWWLWIVVGIVAVWAVGAHADTFSFSNPISEGRLLDSPCSKAKVLAHIPADLRELFKDAEGNYEGKPYAVCWAHQINGTILLLWEDGLGSEIPKRTLKPELGV